MAVETKDMNAVWREASESFNKTMQAGVKLQEETARFWSDMVGRTTDELRTRWEHAASDAAPISRKNTERFQHLFDEQSKRSLELLRKSMDVASVRTPAEMFDAIGQLWQTTFDSMRETNDALTRMNSELMESFSGAVKSTAAGSSTKSTSPRNGRK